MLVSSGLLCSTLILYQWYLVNLSYTYCSNIVVPSTLFGKFSMPIKSLHIWRWRFCIQWMSLFEQNSVLCNNSHNWCILIRYRKVNVTLMSYSYLVDPASSHTLVLKIKPCMSKCIVVTTLDCRRLIITVIVLLRLFYRWIPVEILELIHVTKNIFFYMFSIYLLSNQNASALWMNYNNV